MNRAEFFKIIRPLFARKKLLVIQVKRIEAVIDGLEERSVEIGQAAYIMATAHWESDSFKAMEEYATGKAYEWRTDLGNTLKGDGVRFKGRGLVMITGRRNYAMWTDILKVDFVANPSRVSDLEHAVPILIDGMSNGTFTGKKLTTYIHGSKRDYVNARHVVNGKDKAREIADLAFAYYNAFFGSGYGVAAPSSTVRQPPDDPGAPVAPKTPFMSLTAFLSAFVAVIRAIFGRK